MEKPKDWMMGMPTDWRWLKEIEKGWMMEKRMEKMKVRSLVKHSDF